MDVVYLKVLLVEDVLIYINLLEHMLASSDMILETAQTLEQGLVLASTGNFDAVLLDLGLPDSQGLETFTRFIQAFPEIPIVILTGLDDESLAGKAVQFGAQDYLVKGPYLTRGEAGKNLLVRAIRYAIERHKNQKELRQERDHLEWRVAQRTAQLEQELTERRRVEKALRHSEQKLRVYNERLRSLASKLVSAQEDERRRLSMELHDEAGQALTALKLNLALVRSALMPGNLSVQMDAAIALTEATMDQLRSLAYNLRPPALDALGLNQTLNDYCQRVARQSGLQITYKGFDMPQLPEHYQISLYRVLQEALTNVIKHAEACHVMVDLRQENDLLVLQVQDDGCGFEDWPDQGTKESRGIGLLGVEERLEALGGKIQISTHRGQGASLLAQVPI